MGLRSTVLPVLAGLLSLAAIASAHPGSAAAVHTASDEEVFDGHQRTSILVGWISIDKGGSLTIFVQLFRPALAWFIGDATNLVGGALQGVLPTMIWLASYYLFCDTLLIGQVYYYRRKRALYPERFPPTSATETDPLLSSFSATGPGASSEGVMSKKAKKVRDIVGYVGAITLVAFVAGMAWRLSKDGPMGRKLEVWDTKAQILGWISAVLYLSSRVPQIFKNRETKCQGLSLLMFAFSVAGNTTYVASILLQSMSPQHLLINSSWIIGSGGTIFLDFIVLGQFAWYASARSADKKIFADDEASGEIDDAL
ncbi:hypothetical protein MNV49_003587 [Pseudohyphozyma bogoriensis]|nr:hypothetical protein MNV49_003587 [Pseudohyphozyma bogoriensis]